MQLTINVKTPNNTAGAPWVSTGVLSIDAGGINIGGTSNGTSVNTLTATITDNSTVTVTVTKDGYYPYTMDFNVWTEDLSIDVVLVQIEEVITGLFFNMPYPSAAYIQRPCGGLIDIYDTSSAPGETEFYLNKELLFQGSRYVYQACTTGPLEFIVRKTTYDVVPGSCPTSKTIRWDFYAGLADLANINSNAVAGDVQDVDFYLDAFTDVNIQVQEWKPNIVLEPSLPADPENCGCYERFETVTLTPNLTLYSTPTNYNWKTYAPDGMLLEDVDSATADTIDVTLDNLGGYKGVFSVTDGCGTYTEEIKLSSCQFYDIKTTNACNNYTVTNYSDDISLSVTVADHAGNAVEGITEQTIAGGSTFQYTIPTGMYTFTFSYNATTEVQVVANYCAVEDCLAKYIQDVLCEDTSCNCEYDISAELEAMRNLALANTYFMQLNKFMSIANFYTALDDSLMAEVTSAQQVLDKIVQFCERLGCNLGCGCAGCKDVTNVTFSGTSNCGCS